jgi:DMSO/TMAO reductase YedYZ heme-binding membrane subunit
VVLAALVLLGMLTGGGRSAATQFVEFLRFYGGVFTLVSLTLTVIAGLVATDRIILVARHRMWVQSVHRTLGIVAVSCLGLHISTELVAGRVGVLGMLVPFVSTPFEVGLGTVAAYLMLTVMWTGIVRARFAQNQRAWLWRPLHAVAYLCWPVALLHGLNAGRPPAVWVTASYLVLLFLTVVALGLRLSAERNRRQQRLAADRTTTSIAPVGRPVPAPAGRRSVRSTSRRFRWDAPPAEQTWLDAEAPYRTDPLTPPDLGWQTTGSAYTAPPQPAAQPTIRIPRARPGHAAAPAAEPAGMTLRDRFAARRSKIAEAALEDRYVDDNDTPTLVNLDSQRAMRRKPRDDDYDDNYWAQLRGEAR